MNCTVVPIVLCGGAGTRLWPLSTPDTPKQFMSLGNQSLLDATLQRVKRVQDSLPHIRDPLLVLHKDHLKFVSELKDVTFVLEDFANDTAVAILRALHSLRNSNNLIAWVLPSDHAIGNTDAWVQDVVSVLNDFDPNCIHLFGLPPTQPSSAFGYIWEEANRVNFYEKPNVSMAQNLIETKRALWNSGMFVFDVGKIYNVCLEKQLLDWVTHPHLGKAPSFDILIVQDRAMGLSLHTCRNDWNWRDVGTWPSLLQLEDLQSELKTDNQFQCKDIKMINRTKKQIVVIGCEHLFIIQTDQGILIANANVDESLLNTSLKSIKL